ncbi:2,3-diaminopropionate biosynthesis protein SbnB [Paenibacillus sp. FSL H8-0537]|uniref:2,3-diaminopropionate biosynthesis protein SbnB n=1 Tax=Paenibacillus sp. FSL H8-0537 TaxID=2921399 RepID=UPI003100DAF3
MLYLTTQHILQLGINWHAAIRTIEESVVALSQGDYTQPIKPYLHFNNPENRIIAMPASVGGNTNMAGLKWIASFPNNTKQGLPRAHCVTILNDMNSGVPLAIFNTALLSGIRTAAVSGLIIQQLEAYRHLDDVTLGIVGFGPIGQMHLQMATALLGDRIGSILVYDLCGFDPGPFEKAYGSKFQQKKTWQEVYQASDIFITCTVSKLGYIDQPPKNNALLLNISLRDFTPAIMDCTPSIFVDNWEEVCRAGTDIEVLHVKRGLHKEHVQTIEDIVCGQAFSTLPENHPIFFNPMGMAIFDIAVCTYYYQLALANEIGYSLGDEAQTPYTNMQ